MSILFINTARRWGGTEKWTLLAAEGLAHRGHRVLLAHRSREIGDRFPPEISKLRLPFLFDLDPFTLWRLYHWARRNGTRILVPTKRKEYFIAGLLRRPLAARNLLRLGIVREVHNSVWDRLIYKRWADGIIVNANPIKQTLVEKSGVSSDKIFVLYNGVRVPSRVEGLEPVAPLLTRLQEFEFVLVTVGELSSRKGCDRLLQLFSLARRATNANLGLCLIGEGEQRRELERLAGTLGIASCTIFAGELAAPVEILRACHAFVLLSKNEGMSNAMLEAMACGLPVLTTGAGGAGEAIADGENGFLLAADDAARFTELLSMLLNNPARAKAIGAAAQRTVAERFSIEKMLDGLEQIIALRRV